MGLITRIIGGPAATAALASAATGLAGAFDAAPRRDAGHEAPAAAPEGHGAGSAQAQPGLFDCLVDGLNRLPRPMLALGTLGLFAFAMVDPARFSERMIGLGHVPEPLWWLLGAIVSFYFGAREAHYFRTRPPAASAAARAPGPEPAAGEISAGGAATSEPEPEEPAPAAEAAAERQAAEPAAAVAEPAAAGDTEEDNAALAEWRALARG